MKNQRQRLDVRLMSDGLAPSRERAQALIMSGVVFVDDKRQDKPGTAVGPDAEVDVRGRDIPWVSRGGLKLAHALGVFDLDVAGATAIDVGASTGGFTDVLLHHGAVRVYAVDVGHGQLDWKLRNDDRVVVLERTNARYLTTAEIPEPVDVVVCDASFIGLRTVLPAALALTKDEALLVALIKPQFEAGRERVGKGGVVKDPAVHREVCAMIRQWLEETGGWHVIDVTESPVLGPAGNKEFLIAARRGAASPVT